MFSYIADNNNTYLLESDFNELVSTTVSANNFSLIHFNCRSLNKNYDHIVNYIKLHFSIIECTETWLTSSNEKYFDIKSYNFVCKNRIIKPGGDVGIYITEGLDFKIREDLCSLQNDVFESLFTEILQTNSRTNRIVGVVYRPPGCDANLFNEMLEPALIKVNKED